MRLCFDPAQIALEVLIEVHLRTHASTSNHKLRGKYRSAIYTVDAVQCGQAKAALVRLQDGFDAPLVTRVLPLVRFRMSDERFRNYAVKNAGGPFCERYINPKLDRLRQSYAGYLKTG